ncbi:hypothetical protein, partial [Flavobacterium ichthyis]|uniref:hypothetical protein n=1 Tax=Flavobacterium ichthyis TaxID=2698827 RepID=UPI001AA193CC
SMSPPFFKIARSEKSGLLFFIGAACRPSGSIRRLSLKSSSEMMRIFLFVYCPEISGLTIEIQWKS